MESEQIQELNEMIKKKTEQDKRNSLSSQSSNRQAIII